MAAGDETGIDANRADSSAHQSQCTWLRRALQTRPAIVSAALRSESLKRRRAPSNSVLPAEPEDSVLARPRQQQ